VKFSTQRLSYYVLREPGACFLAQWQSQIYHAQPLSQKGVDMRRLLVFDAKDSFLEVSLQQMFLQYRVLPWLALERS